jgi:hypothetical protein
MNTISFRLRKAHGVCPEAGHAEQRSNIGLADGAPAISSTLLDTTEDLPRDNGYPGWRRIVRHHVLSHLGCRDGIRASAIAETLISDAWVEDQKGKRHADLNRIRRHCQFGFHVVSTH